MVQPYEHFCTSIKIVMAMPELTQKNVQDTLCEKRQATKVYGQITTHMHDTYI